MTKVIAAAIVILVLWGCWELFFYWERIKNQEDLHKKQEAATLVASENLPGMPWQNSQALEKSLQTSQAQGATAMKNWLKNYGKLVQDPRKAAIELDYCYLVAREDPSEARRVFAEVKARIPKDSPLWPRIQQLEKTYR